MQNQIAHKCTEASLERERCRESFGPTLFLLDECLEMLFEAAVPLCVIAIRALQFSRQNLGAGHRESSALTRQN